MTVVPSPARQDDPLVLSGAASGAIIGRREEQQDHVWVGAVPSSEGQGAVLVLLADGMGGHAGGQVASRVAVEAFVTAFMADLDTGDGGRLRRALGIANQALAAEALAKPDLRGMGCTLIAALLQGQRLNWVSVGDSLLMIADGGRVTRINADHSMAPILDRQAADGEITVQEAQTSDERNMLRSALTGRKIAMIDQGELNTGAGARIIAASDGLLTLTPTAFEALVKAEPAPERLIARVLEKIEGAMPDDQDNTTMAVVKTWAAPGPVVAGRSPWRLILAGLLFAAVFAILALVALVVLDGERLVAATPGVEEQGVSQGAQTGEAARVDGGVPSHGGLGPAGGKGPPIADGAVKKAVGKPAAKPSPSTSKSGPPPAKSTPPDKRSRPNAESKPTEPVAPVLAEPKVAQAPKAEPATEQKAPLSGKPEP